MFNWMLATVLVAAFVVCAVPTARAAESAANGKEITAHGRHHGWGARSGGGWNQGGRGWCR